jgi:hypothetical protein
MAQQKTLDPDHERAKQIRRRLPRSIQSQGRDVGSRCIAQGGFIFWLPRFTNIATSQTRRS